MLLTITSVFSTQTKYYSHDCKEGCMFLICYGSSKLIVLNEARPTIFNVAMQIYDDINISIQI